MLLQHSYDAGGASLRLHRCGKSRQGAAAEDLNYNLQQPGLGDVSPPRGGCEAAIKRRSS